MHTTKWAYWDGVRKYEAANRDYLQGQIGNPEGEDKVGIALLSAVDSPTCCP